MSVGNFEHFVNDYYRRFAETLLAFDKGPMRAVLEVFDRVTEARGTVWVAGNGGSAAIANHTVCDCSKGTHVEGHTPLKTISLASNVPMLTALGNDISYDAVFSEQLKYYLTEQDALLVVSSSGNSPNVVKACKYANAKGVPTIAFVGFRGGRLKEIASHVVHVPVENYGIVEDTHQSLIHVLTQYMKMRASA
ncbi:SIS domain-containing protein [Roseibacterium sp. SDUM158017]|uniref:SIS domain-containing protein n=1 Tax=Roseicyclus salinarum TaxID=3036773 RepID=UPI00241513ED|nr:SIS domain-containing protein [Roseibacterium sp. SDUM158017]MDG4649609.1 SIS domain-containing protein [Roseibacterium sp. SDUM158017]